VKLQAVFALYGKDINFLRLKENIKCLGDIMSQKTGEEPDGDLPKP